MHTGLSILRNVLSYFRGLPDRYENCLIEMLDVSDLLHHVCNWHIKKRQRRILQVSNTIAA